MVDLLKTNRCTLSPPSESDRDETFALYSNKDVRQFLGGVINRQAFDAIFTTLLADSASKTSVIRLTDSGAFVGTVNISRHHDSHDDELSYQLLPEHWGLGLALETLIVVLEFAARTRELKSIIAETQTANLASRKLLEKLSMSLDREVVRFGENQVIYRKEFKGLNT